MLASHFSGQTVFGENPHQAALRAQGRLAVALFDYDISVIMRPGSRRLPWRFSTEGMLLNRPMDLEHGEHEYDPFAFDVACLGNLLLTTFTVCVLCLRFEARLTFCFRV